MRVKAPSERALVTLAMLSAVFLTAVSTAIVTTAAPSITGALGGLALYSWVFSAYMLTMTVATPLCGKLADLYGRKPVYLVGVGLFLLGSFLCGLATSMEQLILFRFIQGFGAGAIQPIALTLAGDLFALEQRAKIQGLFSSMWGLSSLIGPPVGGLLVAALGWRWVFWFNLPLGLAAGLLMALVLHETVERRRHQLDWLGAATLATGVSTLLLALFEFGGVGAGSPIGAGPMLLIAAGLLGFFVWWEARAPEPLLPLTLFRLPVVSAGAVLTFIGGLAVLGVTSHVALFVQGVLGGTPVQAGLAILPLDVCWICGTFVSGRLILRYGYRLTVFIGMSVLATAAFAVSRLGADTPILVFGLTAGPCGFGLGCIVAPLTIAVQNSVGWSQRGVATATSVFFRTIGGSVGVAVLGLALNAQLLGLLGAAVGFAPDGLAETARAGDQPARGVAQITAVAQLLDPVERAALDPATAALLRGALEQAVQGVFLLIALACFVGVAVVRLLPGGRAAEHAETVASSAPADAPARPRVGAAGPAAD
jgi:EmrB/QacA subfamily drug resistance transporter